jgi:ABC-type uncharacterized transport system fused permease/ATPase subunit
MSFYSVIRVCLDEATSALNVANEQLMYELLSRQAIPFLSSGHRRTLLKFHRNVLRLSPDRLEDRTKR